MDLSAALVVLGLATLAVLRSGVGVADQDMGFWLRITEAFPRPVAEWRANSVLGPALAGVAGVESTSGWIALHAVVIALVVVVAVVTIVARFPTSGGRRMAATWLALGSLPPVLLQKVGSYDPFTATGALLVVFSRRRSAVIVGGMLLGATSAEQGLIGLLGAGALVVVLAAPDGRPAIRSFVRASPEMARLVLGGAALMGTRALILVAFAAQGVDVPNRSTVLGSLVGESLANAGAAGVGGIFAWFGLAWGVLLLAWASRRWVRSGWLWLVVALVVPAAAATVTTLDGTRVFAMVSLPALLVLLGWVVDRVENGVADAAFARRVTVAALAVSPLVPALITEPNGGGFFVFPWGG